MTPTFPLSLYQSLAGGNVVLFQNAVSKLTVDASTQMLLEPLLEANNVTGSEAGISEIARHSSPNRLCFLADILRKSDRKTAQLFKSKPDILKAARQAVRGGAAVEQRSLPILPPLQNLPLRTEAEKLLAAAKKPATALRPAVIAMAKNLPQQVFPEDAEKMMDFLYVILLSETVDEGNAGQIMGIMNFFTPSLTDKTRNQWLKMWIESAEDPSSILQQWKVAFLIARNCGYLSDPDEKERGLHMIYRAMQLMTTFELCSILYFLSENVVRFAAKELNDIVLRLAEECLSDQFLGAPTFPTPLGWRAKQKDENFLPDMRIKHAVRKTLRELFKQLPEERQIKIYESVIRSLPVWWTTISKQMKTLSFGHWLEWLSSEA